MKPWLVAFFVAFWAMIYFDGWAGALFGALACLLAFILGGFSYAAHRLAREHEAQEKERLERFR